MEFSYSQTINLLNNLLNTLQHKQMQVRKHSANSVTYLIDLSSSNSLQGSLVGDKYLICCQVAPPIAVMTTTLN